MDELKSALYECVDGGWLDVEKLTAKVGDLRLNAVSCGKTNVYDFTHNGERVCVAVERSGAICALS